MHNSCLSTEKWAIETACFPFFLVYSAKPCASSGEVMLNRGMANYAYHVVDLDKGRGRTGGLPAAAQGRQEGRLA